MDFTNPWTPKFAPPTLSTKQQIIHEILTKVSHESLAKRKPVVLAVRANTSYDGSEADEVPLPGRAVSFAKGDCILLRESYNSDWWIGRVVTEGTVFGFVPSTSMLENARLLELNSLKSKMTDVSPGSGESGSSTEKIKTQFKTGSPRPKCQCPYNVIPLIRPILLVGPSLKGHEVTDILQKGLVHYMRSRLKDRISITQAKVDLSLTKRSMALHEETVVSEVNRIYELTKKPQFVLLQSDAINLPSQIKDSHLEPILVYVKINSALVLKKLLNWRIGSKSRYYDQQVIAAEKLSNFPVESFDVILDEYKLEEAGGHLVSYLENYWMNIHNSGPVTWVRRRGAVTHLVRQFFSSRFGRRRSSIRDDSWAEYTTKVMKHIEATTDDTEGKYAHHFYFGIFAVALFWYCVFLIYLCYLGFMRQSQN